MIHRPLLRCAIVFPTLAGASSAAAEEPSPTPVGVLAGRPDAQPATNSTTKEARPDTLLAPSAFVSESAGVSFRPPIGWKQSNKPSDDEIASYANEKNWTLRVTSAALDRPVPLIGVPAKNGAPAQQGMLEIVIDNFKKTTPDADILRDEVVNVDAHFVGVVIARYTLNGQTWLRQQAMVQANEDRYHDAPLGADAGRLYYVFNLVTPAGSDDEAKSASETFSAMIDSVKLLDRTKIKDDQVQRLYRTRSLFTYWKRDEFEKILVPKEYFRILKDDKDAGYIFREELLDSPNLVGVSAPGPIAYERSHLEESDEQGNQHQTDAGIFQYMSFDMAHERWTRSVVLQTKDAKGHLLSTYGSEFGESLREMRRVFAPAEKGGVLNPKDPKAPPAKMVESHFLDVTITGKEQNAAPIHRDLAPFYIPQAAWHFLPRLVVDAKIFPGPRTYLFSVYNTAKREVMLLYVDKSGDQEFTFAGKRTHGFTVTERFGLGGSPTVHYLTSDGTYLGNETKDQRLMTIASTEPEILARWPKANLSRPEPMKGSGTGKTP